MKRILLFVSAVMAAGMLTAAPRSLADAQDAANKFLTSDAKAGLKMAMRAPQLKLAHTQLQADQQPAFYVFNNGDDNGFVVVSADDNAREILGYSDSGSFNEADMPENMKVWFQHYAEEIAYAAQHPSNRAVKMAAVKKAYTPVSPLLGNIEWNQDKPYNNLCPKDQTDNTRSYTGCVATAAAQIMRYWKHPLQGTGEHTNNWDNSGAYSDYKGKGKGSEYANFGETTYDWNNMLESYKGSYSDAQANAVATLMYHAGIACDMTYGGDKVGGSGALTSSMAYALYTYFKYDKSLRYIMQDYVGTAKFEQLFLAELAANRPILMGGGTTDGYGHEFVCDGVDKDGFFHINWGWGGTSNNYFSLTALDPDEHGIGGAASKKGYSVQVEAVIGIKPDEGGALAAPIIDIEPDNDGNYDYKFNKTATTKDDVILFQTDQAYNAGPADVKDAPMTYAVYKEDSTFVKAFGSKKFSMDAGGNYLQSLSYSASFEGLEAGDYLMALAFRMNDTQDWTPIAIYGKGEFFYLHATADSIYISEKKSSGGGGAAGNLDVDYAWANYDPSSQMGKPWTLIMTDEATEEPWVQFYFDSNSNNKIAGTYDLANYAVLWPDADSDDHIMAVSGTLNITCVTAATSSSYGVYSVQATFTGDDSQEYSVNVQIEIPAQDKNKNLIVLQDTPQGGGGGGEVIKLDVAYGGAILFEDYNVWALNLYKDYDSDTKKVTYPDAYFYIPATSKTSIAGEYSQNDLMMGYVALAAGDTIDVVTVINSLKVTCTKAGEQYDVSFKFVASDNNTYSIQANVSMYAVNYSTEQYITLTDKAGDGPIQAIDNVIFDKSDAVKIFQNGQVVIKVGDKTYNILGAELK